MDTMRYSQVTCRLLLGGGTEVGYPYVRGNNQSARDLRLPVVPGPPEDNQRPTIQVTERPYSKCCYYRSVRSLVGLIPDLSTKKNHLF